MGFDVDKRPGPLAPPDCSGYRTRDAACLSAQRAGRQHVAQWRRRSRFIAAAEPRAVQAPHRDRSSRWLGCTAASEDPRHDRRQVAPFRKDRCALDRVAAGSVRTRKANHQGANRIIVHATELSPLAKKQPVAARSDQLPPPTPLAGPAAFHCWRLHRRRPRRDRSSSLVEDMWVAQVDCGSAACHQGVGWSMSTPQ